MDLYEKIKELAAQKNISIRQLEENNRKNRKFKEYDENDWFSKEYWETELEEF